METVEYVLDEKKARFPRVNWVCSGCGFKLCIVDGYKRIRGNEMTNKFFPPEYWSPKCKKCKKPINSTADIERKGNHDSLKDPVVARKKDLLSEIEKLIKEMEEGAVKKREFLRLSNSPVTRGKLNMASDIHKKLVAILAIQSDELEKCEWSYNDEFWESLCGVSWYFDSGGTPEEHGMEFCYKCGKRLESILKQYKG